NDLGQFLVPLGVAPKRAADLSVQLVKMAANIASIRNDDPAAVLAKLETGLRGRALGLKAYGFDLSNARLQEEAFRLGLVKSSVDTEKVAHARTELAIAQAKLKKANDDYGAGTTQVASASENVRTKQEALTKALAGTT